jgi:hypothetical protein
VKCNCVAKNDVIDIKKNDGKTLRTEVLSEFKEQNSTDTIDCTAIKIVWLKLPATAEHLLQEGRAKFKASGAFCSKFEQRESLDLCYNCNRYGYK